MRRSRIDLEREIRDLKRLNESLKQAERVKNDPGYPLRDRIWNEIYDWPLKVGNGMISDVATAVQSLVARDPDLKGPMKKFFGLSK